MRPFILFAALTAALCFAAPARAECAGGVCGLAGRPVLSTIAAPFQAVAQRRTAIRSQRPARGQFVAGQPGRNLLRALRGVGSLFVR
jgi:hypothetical protein